LEGFTGNAVVAARTQSRELSLTAFVHFAKVEAVVDDDAAILIGVAPAVDWHMLTQVANGIHLISLDQPSCLPAFQPYHPAAPEFGL